MTLLEDVRTQVDTGSHALSDLARSAVEKAPDVVEATLDELHRNAPHAFEQAHELGEQIVTGVQERLAMYIPGESGPLQRSVDHGDGIVGRFPGIGDGRRYTGIRRAHGLNKQARRMVGRAQMKSSGRAWRRSVAFILLGLGVGVIVNRVLKTRHRSEVVEAATSSTPSRPQQSESTPYHTVNADSGGSGGVYHDREDCPAGKRILSEHRVSGTGGRDRCKDCQSLAS
jgi:hypothetical protein